MKGKSETLATYHLFDTDEDTTKLSLTDTDLLHNCFAWLLYLSELARPYIQLEISFLYNRLRDSDVDDYKKLERVKKYIQSNIGMPLILSIDKSENIIWYVDAAFQLHKYMRSHTCGFITMVTIGAYV